MNYPKIFKALTVTATSAIVTAGANALGTVAAYGTSYVKEATTTGAIGGSVFIPVMFLGGLIAAKYKRQPETKAGTNNKVSVGGVTFGMLTAGTLSNLLGYGIRYGLKQTLELTLVSQRKRI